MIRRPPRSTLLPPPFPTRRSSDLVLIVVSARPFGVQLASEIVERALDMRREQMLGRRGIAVEPRFDELTMLEIGAILAARGLEMRDHIAFRHHLESLDQLRGEQPPAPPHERGMKGPVAHGDIGARSEEHTSELQSLMRLSY